MSLELGCSSAPKSERFLLSTWAFSFGSERKKELPHLKRKYTIDKISRTSGWSMFRRSGGSRTSLHNAIVCTSMQSGPSNTCFYQRKLISAEHGGTAAPLCHLHTQAMMNPLTKTPVECEDLSNDYISRIREQNNVRHPHTLHRRDSHFCILSS